MMLSVVGTAQAQQVIFFFLKYYLFIHFFRAFLRLRTQRLTYGLRWLEKLPQERAL